MSAQAHVQPVLWFDLDEQSRFFSRIKRTLLLSLVLHLVVLLIAAGLRLPQRGERPLASVEVSLVSLPTSTPTPTKSVEVQKRVEVQKPAEPKPAPLPVPVVKQEAAEPRPAPVPAMKQEAAIPTPKAAPMPAPAPPTPAVPAPVVAPLKLGPVPAVPSPRQSVAKDILRDVELPPDAPKFGDFTPTKTVEPPTPASKKKPKLPDIQIPNVSDLMAEQEVKPLQHAMPAPAQQAPLSDRLDKELQEELMKVKQFQPAAKLEIPKETPVKPPPVQEASAPAAAVPQTMLKTSGSSGTNPFWAKVQTIIQNNWEPPPIDVTGTTYRVVVKFRFFRNGTVKDVGIQQPSGNGYFDDAGRRAVLKPRVFPPFPAEMTEAYQDVEMLFQVGETAG
ncbi:MAG TPA: TonB family protein [Nitrospira sp.]|nr:TonB family protein [Nitrospira sp.]